MYVGDDWTVHSRSFTVPYCIGCHLSKSNLHLQIKFASLGNETADMHVLF